MILISIADLSILNALNCLRVIFRDTALSNAEQQIKSLQLKLDSALSTHQSQKEGWERSLRDVEETWRCTPKPVT